MKLSYVALPLLLILNYGCGKTESSGCQPATVESEKPAMVAYCNARNINYMEQNRGLLYQIMDPGNGTSTPADTSVVTVHYVGKLLNGSTFDSSVTPFTSRLSQLIDGWKIGIPLIKKGGKIKLIIPSALGYSCTGAPPIIPGNSPLFFEVSLVDVK